MSSVFSVLIPIALLAVVVVLFLGFLNMFRGGSPQRSQKLMQMRVLLQFVALVVLMLALFFMSRG